MARRPRLIASFLPRALVLACAAVVLLVAVAQLARASDPPQQVTLQPAGGGAPLTLAFADLAAAHDVHGVDYTLRSADGSTRTVTVADGISLAALLRAANVDPASFSYIAVARPDGTSVLVLHDQVVGDGAEGPPVLWSDADGLHFLRPSTGPGDVNDADAFVAANGTLAVGLRTGDPLGVRIDASSLHARPHRPISFHAVLLDGGDAAGVTFDWYFADGTGQAHGARIVHRFGRPGTYLVEVNVKQSGRALDTHDIQPIRIAAPPRKHHHPAKGGQGGGAGDGGAGGGSGGTGTGTTGTGGATTGGSTTTGNSTNGGGAGATAIHPPRSRTHHHPSHRPVPRPPRQPQGTLVSGTLLASASATPLPAAVSARGGQDGTPTDSPLRIPAIAWVAAGLAAILALGWALEARHTPPFWQP